MSSFEKLFGPPLKKPLPREKIEKEVLQDHSEHSFEELFGLPLERENKIEPIDQHTLAFVKEHIDVLELGHFDPEWELGEIKKISKSVREGNRHGAKVLLMENFKNKLAEFRKNMSYAQQELETFLRSNPDASQQAMLSKVDAILKKNQAQSQEGHFYQAVDKFRKARKVVKNVAKQYQEQFGDHWPAELFKKLFGRLPEGNLAIDILPMSLFFHIHSLSDYAVAFGASEEQANASGGRILSVVSAIPELSGKILLENSNSIRDRDYSLVTRTHEEEHAIHQTIYPLAIFSTKRKWTDNFWERRGDFNMNMLNNSLKNMMLFVMDRWERLAKTEILSYLKDGRDIQYIKTVLSRKDGQYNYLNLDGDHFTDGIVELWGREKDHLKIKNEDGTEINANELKSISLMLIKEAWEQYKNNLVRALEVVSFFLEKHGEAKRPTVLRLLSQEPLNKWHRLNKLLS